MARDPRCDKRGRARGSTHVPRCGARLAKVLLLALAPAPPAYRRRRRSRPCRDRPRARVACVPAASWRRRRHRVAGAPAKKGAAIAPGCRACPACTGTTMPARIRRERGDQAIEVLRRDRGISPSRMSAPSQIARQRPDAGLERAGKPGRVVRIGDSVTLAPPAPRDTSAAMWPVTTNTGPPCSPARPRPPAAPWACRRRRRGACWPRPCGWSARRPARWPRCCGAAPLKTASACAACNAWCRGRTCARRLR